MTHTDPTETARVRKADLDRDAPFFSYAHQRGERPRVHVRLVEKTFRMYPIHKHDYFQILYFLTEAPPLRINMRSMSPREGSIYFVQTMAPHQVRFNLKTRCVVIYFDLDFLRPDIARSYPVIDLVRFAPELMPFVAQNVMTFDLPKQIRAEVNRSIENMLRHERSGNAFSREIVRAELSLMLATICGEYHCEISEMVKTLPAAGRDSDHMRRISEFVADNYFRKITLSEVAGSVSISKSRVCHLVRQYTGGTLVSLIRQMRIEDACERLILTNEAIGQISHSVGYDDYKFFIRTFKKVTGTTPRAYRHKETSTRFSEGMNVPHKTFSI